jgi:penicillin-binding protein 2
MKLGWKRSAAVVAMMGMFACAAMARAAARTTTRTQQRRHAAVRGHIVAAHSTATRGRTERGRAAHASRAAYSSRDSRNRSASQSSSHTVIERTVVMRHGRRVVVSHVVSARSSRSVLSRFPEPRLTTANFNPNLTAGDVTDGEDPVVRAAAIEALGNSNGTALAIDPATGRILAMVNQKLALSAGAEPCSTIKVAVALAGLKEGIIKADTPVNLGRHYSLDLTQALARSVNVYFETLGRALGFERVKHYANEFGLGELAGYGIQGEQLGVYPDHALPEALGGVGRMCSFGESISMTPLQLGALVSAVANGGTLFYLQHPTTAAALSAFEPKVKRLLDIKGILPDLLPGMEGAVDFGTARSLHTNFVQFPVFGKTGTCSNNGTHLGWFVSYGDAPSGRIVTVVFLDGADRTSGPRAAEVTGQFYRAMYERNYFGAAGVARAQGGR